MESLNWTPWPTRFRPEPKKELTVLEKVDARLKIFPQYIKYLVDYMSETGGGKSKVAVYNKKLGGKGFPPGPLPYLGADIKKMFTFDEWLFYTYRKDLLFDFTFKGSIWDALVLV